MSEPITDDFVSRLATAGHTLSAGRIAAYDAFIVAGGTNGWLDHIVEMYAFEGSAVAHAAVKLVYAPATAASLTNVGYADGDINTSGGMLSATAGRYWETINENTIPNIAGIGAWIRDAHFGVSGLMIGNSNGAIPYFQLSSSYSVFNNNVTQIAYAVWGDGTNQINAGRSLGRGLYRAQRAALDSLKLQINNVEVGSVASAIADTRRNVALRVAESPIPMDLGFIDDGAMTSGQLTAFYEDLATLMAALGRLPLSQSTNHALILGQSLGAGTGGDPSISETAVAAYATRQPYFGTRPSDQAAPFATFGALFESADETIATELAHTLAQARRVDVADSFSYDLTLANFSVGSAPYSSLAQGTSTYNNSIASITQAKGVADITHRGTYRVPGIFVLHGETDGASTTYQADIETWQANYETDIKAITGQAGIIPMFHSQISAWTSPSNLGTATAKSPYAVLAAHVADPTRTVLVGPKYFLPYDDGLHLTGPGYNLLGGYYAKAAKAVFDGGTFEPLRPISITRDGAVITIVFTGRVGALVLDTTAVSNPGNYGFEWAQTGGTAQTISSVALSDGNTRVRITLTGDPGTPTTERVRYAYTGTPNANGGPTTGPRGNLRDSDATENYSGNPMPNWCVHFDEASTIGPPPSTGGNKRSRAHVSRILAATLP